MSEINKDTINRRWKEIFIIGGIFSFLLILTALAEIIFTLLPDGTATDRTVVEWFNLLQRNPFMGMRNLGLVNIFLVSFGIPTMLAIYIAHRKVDKSFALLAVVISFIGTAVFYATNRAFPMLELSGQYAVATTEAQQAMIESAGKAMLSVGGSHTPGTFLAFILSSLSGLLLSIVMLRNNVFGKVNAIAGVLCFSIFMVFEVLTSFVSSLNDVTMGLAMVAGILYMVWYLLLGLRLFHIARSVNTSGTNMKMDT